MFLTILQSVKEKFPCGQQVGKISFSQEIFISYFVTFNELELQKRIAYISGKSNYSSSKMIPGYRLNIPFSRLTGGKCLICFFEGLLFEDLHHLSQQRIENMPRYYIQQTCGTNEIYNLVKTSHNHVRYILGMYNCVNCI